MKGRPVWEVENVVNLLKDGEVMYTQTGKKGSVSEPLRLFKLKPNNDGLTFSVYLRHGKTLYD